ncbi:hypothetical protein PI125_g23716 [Phytophthora idaei]|nr:hypothetical protein PI125_g23716 [Phytophthora idaei]
MLQFSTSFESHMWGFEQPHGCSLRLAWIESIGESFLLIPGIE